MLKLKEFSADFCGVLVRNGGGMLLVIQVGELKIVVVVGLLHNVLLCVVFVESYCNLPKTAGVDFENSRV